MSNSKRAHFLPLAHGNQSRLRPSAGMLSPPLTPESHQPLPSSTSSPTSSAPPRPVRTKPSSSSLRPPSTAFLSPPTTPQKNAFPSISSVPPSGTTHLTALTFPRLEHESPSHSLNTAHLEPASSHSDSLSALLAPPPTPHVLVLPDGFFHDSPPLPPRQLHLFTLHPLVAYRPPVENYPLALRINFRSYSPSPPLPVAVRDSGIDIDLQREVDEPATYPGRKHIRIVSSFLPITIDISNPPNAPNEFITVRQVLDAVSYTLSRSITTEEWVRATREQRERVFLSSTSSSPSNNATSTLLPNHHPRSSSSPPQHIPATIPSGNAFGYIPHSSQTRLDFLGDRTWFAGLRGDPTEIKRILGIGFGEEEGSLEEQVMSETLILMLSSRPDGRD